MKLGVMQPYFFPYIGYWQLMNLVDEYVIFDDVNYIKRGWIHRNNILVSGQAKQINLHIKDASQNRLIMDTQVAETEEDIKKLLETIQFNYKKAPYFEPVYTLIENILRYESTCLSEYLANQIRQVCGYLGIETKILLSSEIDKDPELRGEEKILAICEKRGADCYVNAIGGKELYHHEKFAEHGMELKFLRTEDVVYSQLGKEFVPNLSIIDVMMFNSVEEVRGLLNQCSLED